MTGSQTAEQLALAERLARLTEELASPSAISAGAGIATGATASGQPGVAVLERVLRAFSALHRHPCADAGPNADEVSFVWGHLQAHERLGSGSYGEVYRAYDRVLERDVALKLRSGDDMTARSYIFEARRLARVRHPNVLAVHGAAVHGGRAGLWCDLIEGQPLNRWVAQSGPQPRAAVLQAGCALAAALQAVHAAGLIHGDVKPGNVMRANDGHLVLMDFGTAVEDGAGGVHALYGSPLAMAPEQMDGSRISSAADLYALGVVLYFLSCGRYPLSADSLAELSGLHARGISPDWKALRSRCGVELAAVVERLLSRDPALRPDAASTGRELQGIIEAPQRRRRRWLLLGIIGALATALVVSLVSLQRINAERSAAARAYQRELAARGFMRDLMDAPRPGVDGANVRVVDLLADAPSVAEQRFPNDPLALATTLGDLGRSYYAMDAHAEARPLLQRAAALGREYGLASNELLGIEIAAAAIENYLTHSGSSREALAALYAKSRQMLGDDHRVTLQAALELASALGADADHEASEALLRKVIAQHGRNENSSDGQLLTAQNRLVALLAGRQRWEEAETLLAQAIAAARTRLGESAASTLMLRSTAATIASGRGRHASAEMQLASLLDDTEQRYGTQHRNVLTILNNLAISQRMQGKTQAALVNLTRALGLARSQLGEEHMAVLKLRDNVASAMADAGDSEASRALREENYAIKSRVLGQHHPTTLLSAINLAEQYVEDGQLQNGLALAESAAVDAKAVFGEQHLYTLEAREIGARALLEQGHVARAREQLLQVLADKRALLGDDDTYTLRSAGFLAAAHQAAGERDAAIALLRPTLAAMRAQYDASQPDLRRVQSQLASLER